MCVIVCKPRDVDMPSEDTLRKCFTHNSDGAGYMYQLGDKIRIKKGFMKFKDFYENVMKDYNECGDKRTFVLHFRIGTLGSRSAGLTHPYPLSKNLDDLKQTVFDTNIGVAHNGIISLTSKTTYKEDKNDTMAFITDYLALFIKSREDLEDDDKMQVIKNLIGGSNKFAFLTNGKLFMLGDFTEDKNTGCYFSNMYWNHSYYSSSYTNYDGYQDRWYDDDYYCGVYRGGYISKAEDKKEEKKEDKPEDIIEGQVGIEDVPPQDNFDLYEYYEQCYDPDKKVYDFVKDDCPFAYEETIDYCERNICGFFNRCCFAKKNNKVLRRQKRLYRKLRRKEKRKNGKR